MSFKKRKVSKLYWLRSIRDIVPRHCFEEDEYVENERRQIKVGLKIYIEWSSRKQQVEHMYANMLKTTE